MEQTTENIHAQEVPKSLKPEQHKYKKPQEPICNFSSTSTGGPKEPKQRCIRIQSPDEDLKKLSENRPKVSLTRAEIEEDMKFFSQIMQGATTSSDTRQKKVLSVSEAAHKPELNEVPGVSAKLSKPRIMAPVTKKDYCLSELE